MKTILEQANATELNELIGKIQDHWSHRLISEFFKRKVAKHPKYDSDLLWFLMYKNEYCTKTLEYVESNYKKFREDLKILDSDFAKEMVLSGKFHARFWEMIMSDVLFSYGTLIPKTKGGPDFLLETPSGQTIQIEATTPGEATDPKLQTVKPVYDDEGFFSHGGSIAEAELPIVLRFLQGFDKKAAMDYPTDRPLIIAINTGPVIGLSTLDDFVLRQALFGLGCATITRHQDGSFSNGLQQTPRIDKGGGPFKVARFLDPDYSHVSGVIYSSQKPHSLTPHGHGWTNSGLVYVPNPFAKHPANIKFECMSSIVVTDKEYREEKAIAQFQSCVL